VPVVPVEEESPELELPVAEPEPLVVDPEPLVVEPELPVVELPVVEPVLLVVEPLVEPLVVEPLVVVEPVVVEVEPELDPEDPRRPPRPVIPGTTTVPLLGLELTKPVVVWLAVWKVSWQSPIRPAMTVAPLAEAVAPAPAVAFFPPAETTVPF